MSFSHLTPCWVPDSLAKHLRTSRPSHGPCHVSSSSWVSMAVMDEESWAAGNVSQPSEDQEVIFLVFQVWWEDTEDFRGGTGELGYLHFKNQGNKKNFNEWRKNVFINYWEYNLPLLEKSCFTYIHQFHSVVLKSIIKQL